MTYILLLPFALAPSFIWLAFYLRKDSHPEPNRMILKIFFFGMLVTIPAIVIERLLEEVFSGLPLSRTVFLLAYFLFDIALIEELLKYLVVRVGAYSNAALDEPLDFMLYMVIAGLGFAALENIFLLFDLIKIYPASNVFLVNIVRLLEAVFLHALASGTFGYFLALSFLPRTTTSWIRSRRILFLTGLVLATLLHGLFNFYIFTVGGKSTFLLLAPIIPLLLVGLLISLGFRKLKILWSR